MKNSKPQNNKGFTLVETLVAISIFSVSLIGLLNVLGSGISNTNYAKKKIVATYLAQEGIEYVRNIRDTYVLYSATSAAGWTAFINKLNAAGCGNTTYGCYFDDQTLDFTNPNKPVTNIPFYACSAPACPGMTYDPTYAKYNYLSGSAAGYTRVLIFSPVNANEVKITSKVYWGQGSGTYNISFSENLFNWVE
jgi:prepilin-type N-terminal cleavage/methylation domain-containing protein